ncbi:MAG: nucleoside 2-deoxyribosyltransferase [Dehalococcoidia bacterium]
MRVYLAGPLFTPYQRAFLEDLAHRLRILGIEVFVPHEQLLEGPLTPSMVFNSDAAGLRNADVVLAVLDGDGVDDGTACEIGIFAELLRTSGRQGSIIGLMTDIRTLRNTQDAPHMNLFVRGCIERHGALHTDIDETITALQVLAEEVGNGRSTDGIGQHEPGTA